MNNGALPTHLKPLREPTVYKEGFGGAKARLVVPSRCVPSRCVPSRCVLGTLLPLAAAVAVQALSVRVVAEGV